MNIPSFDIFSGRFPDKDVLWLESVEDLAAAAERMSQRAAKDPGPYFVFCTRTHQVLASVDTTVLDTAGTQNEKSA